VKSGQHLGRRQRELLAKLTGKGEENTSQKPNPEGENDQKMAES